MVNTVTATGIPTSAGELHQYSIDWDALSQGQPAVTLQIDSDGDGTFEQTIITTPPYAPSVPSPTDGATGTPTDSSLKWTGGDPDQGDNVTYQVYFGTNDNLQLVSDNQTANSFNPGTLNYNTQYYWKVIARDNHGITTEGPIWSFITGSAPSTGGGGNSGGGGGGGGGGYTSIINLLDSQGRLLQDVTANSPDLKAYLTLPKGTVPKSKAGGTFSSILIRLLSDAETRPVSPEFSIPATGYYVLGPSGATFDPPITLTFKYDPSLLPEGAGENSLSIVRWDELNEQWIALKTHTDPDKYLAWAEIDHFSIYTLMARTRPAAFNVSSLKITPDEVYISEPVKISVLLTNTGDLGGSYTINLQINNIVKETKEVTLAGGDNVTVSFSVTQAEAGEYTVAINGLSGRFYVNPPKAVGTVAEVTTPETPTTPKPAIPELTTSSTTPTPLAAPTEPPITSTTTQEPNEQKEQEASHWGIISSGITAVIVLAGLVAFVSWRRHRSPN